MGGPQLKRRPLVGGQDVEHCAGQLGWGRHLVVGQLGASGIVYTLDCVAYNKTAVNSRTVDDVAGSRKSAYTAGIVMVCCLPVIVGLIAMFAYLSDYSLVGPQGRRWTPASRPDRNPRTTAMRTTVLVGLDAIAVLPRIGGRAYARLRHSHTRRYRQ